MSVRSLNHTHGIMPPVQGDDCCKIFLSNLAGRINTEDLNEFFCSFGTIEHIESWTTKSAIILYADMHSIDRVLAEYRTCTINNQEIFIRRIRYGYIERVFMDSSVLFIQSSLSCMSIEWSEKNIRHSFNEYDECIDDIRVDSTCYQAWIFFNDYDIVDRILLQASSFRVDGMSLNMKRARRLKQEKNKTSNQSFIEQLLETNQILRKQIQRKL
jgi:RNA recognition motif-containing protein